MDKEQQEHVGWLVSVTPKSALALECASLFLPLGEKETKACSWLPSPGMFRQQAPTATFSMVSVCIQRTFRT